LLPRGRAALAAAVAASLAGRLAALAGAAAALSLPLGAARRLLGSARLALRATRLRLLRASLSLSATAAFATSVRRARTLLVGRRGRAAAGVETLDGAHLDLLVDEALDGAEQRTVLGADQRERFSRRARAAGAADAVDVILGDVRQVEVHDVRQLDDVDAARGDVGRHEHLHLAFLEILERTDARVLALVAVDRVGVDSVLHELCRERFEPCLVLQNTSTCSQLFFFTRCASSSRLRVASTW
jgi:hypothetical protein